MQHEKIDKKVEILDWGIIFSFIVMMIVIYIPLSIWEEEEKYKNESRKRMEIIVNAQEFYKELTGQYTDNGQELFRLVESAIDSTIADSLFFGKQSIEIGEKTNNVDISKGFLNRADTTFSIGVKRKKVVIDTIYTVEMNNEETNGIDTAYVNTGNIFKVKNDTLFKRKVINTTGKQWSTLQTLTFGKNTQPLHVILKPSNDPQFQEELLKDKDGKYIQPKAYKDANNIEVYTNWLKEGLEDFYSK